MVSPTPVIMAADETTIRRHYWGWWVLLTIAVAVIVAAVALALSVGDFVGWPEPTPLKWVWRLSP